MSDETIDPGPPIRPQGAPPADRDELGTIDTSEGVRSVVDVAETVAATSSDVASAADAAGLAKTAVDPDQPQASRAGGAVDLAQTGAFEPTVSRELNATLGYKVSSSADMAATGAFHPTEMATGAFDPAIDGGQGAHLQRTEQAPPDVAPGGEPRQSHARAAPEARWGNYVLKQFFA
jgi:hypothetical protein